MNFKKLGREPFTPEKLERLRATDPGLHKIIAPRFDGVELRLPSMDVANRLDDWLVKEEQTLSRARGFEHL
jgi:hypothetical protein